MTRQNLIGQKVRHFKLGDGYITKFIKKDGNELVSVRYPGCSGDCWYKFPEDVFDPHKFHHDTKTIEAIKTLFVKTPNGMWTEISDYIKVVCKCDKCDKSGYISSRKYAKAKKEKKGHILCESCHEKSTSNRTFDKIKNT